MRKARELTELDTALALVIMIGIAAGITLVQLVAILAMRGG